MKLSDVFFCYDHILGSSEAEGADYYWEQIMKWQSETRDTRYCFVKCTPYFGMHRLTDNICDYG